MKLQNMAEANSQLVNDVNDRSSTINEQRNQKAELEGQLMSSENNFSNLNASYTQLSGEHEKLRKTLDDLNK